MTNVTAAPTGAVLPPPSAAIKAAVTFVVRPLGEEIGWGWTALILAGLVYVSGHGLIAVPLIVLATLVAAHEAWQHKTRQVESTRYRNVRTLSAVAAATFYFGALPWYLGMGRTTTLIALVVLEGLLRRPATAETRAWYSHARLVDALIGASVLTRPRGDDPLPKLSYRGKARVDDRGTEIVVDLPVGKTWQDVAKRRSALAGALGAKEHMLFIGEGEDSERSVSLWLAKSSKPPVSERSHLATAERTVFTDPFRIGLGSRYREVTACLFETNTLVGAKPGWGKTSFDRLPVAQALLDPRTTFVGGDGKGSTKDWGVLVDAGLASRWTWGTDEDPASEMVATLRWALGVVRYRNKHSRTPPPGGWPGLFILLEEFQDIRAGATAAQQAELDEIDGRIMRMGRAVHVHVCRSTQRPSAEDVPSGSRNLITDSVCMVVRNGRDAELVLGVVPDMALPRRKGEALHGTPAGIERIQFDYLDEEDFAAICQRAVDLRDEHGWPELPATLDDKEPAVAEAEDSVAPAVSLFKDHEPTPGPTVEEQQRDEILVALHAEPMLSQKLMGRLPGHLQPRNAKGEPSTTKLGMVLSQMAKQNLVERAVVGRDSNAWKVRAGVRIPQPATVTALHAGPGTPASGPSEAPIHAQNAAQAAQGPQVPEQPGPAAVHTSSPTVVLDDLLTASGDS